MTGTVANANNPDPMDTGNDEQSAQADDLDELLKHYGKEFDEDTKKPNTAKDPKEDKLTSIEERLAYFENKEIQNDVENATSLVMEEIGEDVPVTKKMVKALLNDMASDDPRLNDAFNKQHQNKEAWQKVLKAAAKSIKKEVLEFNVDRKLTDDQRAVTAAVMGSKTTATSDDSPNFSKMSDAEFQQWKLDN
jgi:hypothetical protein